MNKLICYIPFFVARNEACDQLYQTVRSLECLAGSLHSIRVIYCQPEYAHVVAGLELPAKGTGALLEPRQIACRNPMDLPTAVFQLMQTEGETDDLCFYLEGDHVVQIAGNFIDLVFQEVMRSNVVMPHRLGRWPIHKNKTYPRWGEYYVGNYAPPGIHGHSEAFQAVTGYYNAYAGAYLAARSVIRHHRISYPLMHNLIWRGAAEYLRQISGRRLFSSQAPYGLLLEAPSLIFEANGQCVLKPCNVSDLHIIHLSREGGV